MNALTVNTSCNTEITNESIFFCDWTFEINAFVNTIKAIYTIQK